MVAILEGLKEIFQQKIRDTAPFPPPHTLKKLATTEVFIVFKEK